MRGSALSATWRARQTVSAGFPPELEILLRQAALLLRNIPEPLGEKWIPFRRPEDQDDAPARLEKFLPYHQVRTRFLGSSHADDA
jgi:hypothetical protein